jgi:hypothetical protein
LYKKRFFRENQNKLIPCVIKSLTTLPHNDLIKCFNKIFKSILKYYRYLNKKKQLKFLLQNLKTSAAYTLALRLGSKRIYSIYQKFGKSIKCPQTGVQLVISKKDTFFQ